MRTLHRAFIGIGATTTNEPTGGTKEVQKLLRIEPGRAGITRRRSDVWIASQGNAHIQATGLDAAGRTQYLYHQQWQDDRDQEKFIRALAAAIRIIDRAGLRVGGASYAEENGSCGTTAPLFHEIRGPGRLSA
ncbi:hypothetical protein MB46_06305 [Arthrobacter alpinus]|nr:hypothetical protein MB46_06305 [Arthrobacter alpinus]